MSSHDGRLDELGGFLRARRAELSPHTVGLPADGTPRRVPGLRREEVARLAAISTDYYTRLEQGRLPASAPVLDSLTRVLHLDDDQRDYLYELAGKDVARPRRRATQRVRPQMQKLLDQLVATPAIIQGRRKDILAWNPLAAALMVDFARVPEKHRNYVRLLFTDPTMRTLYDDWETVAQTCVAQLRREAAQNPDDPRLRALVGDLTVSDPQFARWWAAHQVADKSVGTKTLHHGIAGDLVLDWDTLTCAGDPDQQLIVWTGADTASDQGLAFLASWAAEPTSDEHRSGSTARSE